MRVIIITTILTALSCILSAEQITVCPSCPVASIKEGIELASPGDTLWIKEGLYREGNIVIDRALHVVGVGDAILDGDNEHEVLTIAADSVTITGLEIRNVGTSYLEDRAGIRIKRSDWFVIEGNILSNTFFGIYVEHGDDGIIRNNQVVGNAVEEMSSGNAIHLWYCERVEILDNFIAGHRDGIYLEFVNDSEVIGNTSENNLRYGLHFMFSNQDTYSKNIFKDNGAGVAVMFSKFIFMYDNVFEDNWGQNSYGLLLKEIYDGEIEGNIFRRNSIGIFVEGSTRINYMHNAFQRNGWAIRISGGCLDNVIENNNFIGNTFDLSVRSSANNNSFDGNYWSQYSGYDLDKDGVGDVPYRPVKLFSYVVDNTPESIVLLRSLFIDIINFSERVSPVLTPADVQDGKPLMKVQKVTTDRMDTQ